MPVAPEDSGPFAKPVGGGSQKPPNSCVPFLEFLNAF